MLLISDANILIDMEAGGLLEVMFQLEETFAVPDVLFSEELEANHARLPALGLQIKSLSETGVASVFQLQDIYSGPSINDLFALELAREMVCPLLTGDKALRAAAKHEGIDYKGTLWLVEHLVKCRLINAERAEKAYARMRMQGRRLPWDKAFKRLKTLTVKRR
jgi:predicted nucleic acid-binding protein